MGKILQKYKNMPIQVKASLWFLICSFLQKGISMITTPIFTRLMNTSEYGNFNVFNSWLGIVTIFVSLNLGWGVYTQGLIKFDKERDIFSSSLQSLTLFLTIVWTGIYLLFRNFWNKLFSLTTVQMLAMLVMIWTSAAFNFWASEQRIYFKYRLLVIITLLVSIGKPVLGIVLVKNASDKVTARILSLLLIEIIFYSWCFFAQIFKGRCIYSSKFWKYAVLYNIPLIPHYLSQTVLNNADRIMINNMEGEAAAGIYSLAYSLAMIMTLFNSALGQTMSPWIYQKIKEKRICDIAPVAYISLLLVAFVNLVLIVLAPEVVRVFAPSSYYEAIYCIPPIAMGCLLLYSYDLFAKFAFYFEKTKLIMSASVAGAVLNIILNYWGIKKWGYIAAAYTTLICYMIYVIFHYSLMIKICNDYLGNVKPYNTKWLIGGMGIFLLLGFGALQIYDYPYIRYLIIGLLIILAILKRKKIVEIIKKLNLKNC